MVQLRVWHVSCCILGGLCSSSRTWTDWAGRVAGCIQASVQYPTEFTEKSGLQLSLACNHNTLLPDLSQL